MEVVCGRIYKYVVQEVVTHACMWMSKHWCAPNQVLREDKNVEKENYGVPISYVTKNYNTRLNCYSIRQHHYDRLLISLHYNSLKNVELIQGVAICW